MAQARAVFGEQIRDWRQRRRLSQLELAGDARISTRHLSFIETGRSRPSRGMLLHLAELLDVGADARAGRYYLPEEDLILFEVTAEQLAAGRPDEGFQELVAFQVTRARMWFRRARPLLRKVGPGLAGEVGEIWRSGMQTLDRIDAGEIDLLAARGGD